jgi:DNA-3-methyladenine glycosylase
VSQTAPRARLLRPSFYNRDALEVARELLGQFLRRDEVTLRITETEAYRWPDDSANHCRMGRTRRNAAMWGPPGHAYVYLCYGLHNMLNFVTGPRGEGAAVLIRACEPVSGQTTITARRRGIQGPAQLTGPGKIGQTLALDTSWSEHALYRRGGLTVHEGPRIGDHELLAGPRVGVDYARPEHRDAPWRFAVAETRWVSARKTLRPASRVSAKSP